MFPPDKDKPECDLRRIHTAKLFRQHDSLLRPTPNGHSTQIVNYNESGHVLISCTATSNPPPIKFSWFRRNGSSLIEIHPSPETDHSLFVAIQDYDYDEDYYHSNSDQRTNQYLSDQNSPALGQMRQSTVMSVPEYANLEEYACLVSNHIGESEPCWFQDPVQGQISSGKWRNRLNYSLKFV